MSVLFGETIKTFLLVAPLCLSRGGKQRWNKILSSGFSTIAQVNRFSEFHSFKRTAFSPFLSEG